MKLTVAQRKAITLARARRWAKATKSEKATILDVVTATTGWNRVHARKQLRRAVAGQMPSPRKKRAPVKVPPVTVAESDQAAMVLTTPNPRTMPRDKMARTRPEQESLRDCDPRGTVFFSHAKPPLCFHAKRPMQNPCQ